MNRRFGGSGTRQEFRFVRLTESLRDFRYGILTESFGDFRYGVARATSVLPC